MKKILSILILAMLVFSFAACSNEKTDSTQTDADGNVEADFVFAEKADGTFELTHYNGQDTNVIVPKDHNGKSVTSVAAFAFEGRTDITSVTVPDSVTEIKSCAFAGCTSLEQLTLHENAVKLTKESFADTPWYGSFADGFVIINGTLLEYKALDDSMTAVTIPDGVKRIGERAFFGSAVRSVEIPEGVTHIGERAFGSCTSLMKISLPDTIYEIGYGAFHDTAWYNMQKGTIVVDGILVGCKSGGVSITIPSNVKTISGGAFLGCTAIVINVPEGVETICDYAFSGCTQVVKINLPSTVTKISSKAFELCPTIQSVYVSEDNEYYSNVEGSLYDKEGETLIYAPEKQDSDDSDEAKK